MFKIFAPAALIFIGLVGVALAGSPVTVQTASPGCHGQTYALVPMTQKKCVGDAPAFAQPVVAEDCCGERRGGPNGISGKERRIMRAAVRQNICATRTAFRDAARRGSLKGDADVQMQTFEEVPVQQTVQTVVVEQVVEQVVEEVVEAAPPACTKPDCTDCPECSTTTQAFGAGPDAGKKVIIFRKARN